MADNVTFQSTTPATPPSGEVVAAQDIGGVKYQEVIILGLTGDATYQGVRIDTTTHAIEVISYAHHEVHSGNHFYMGGYVELNSAGVLRVKMVTPNTTKWSHLLFSIKSSGICTTTFDEGASGGMTGGSGVTPLNNNRNSGTASGMVFTSGVTAADSYVTRIENDKWGVDSNKQMTGGGGARGDELILKQGTTYLRTFTSGSDNNIIQFRASWYEHTAKTA